MGIFFLKKGKMVLKYQNFYFLSLCEAIDNYLIKLYSPTI
jgi:hypothetical protein